MWSSCRIWQVSFSGIPKGCTYSGFYDLKLFADIVDIVMIGDTKKKYYIISDFKYGTLHDFIV